MIILGVDTVSRQGGVALVRGDQLLTRDLADPRRHAERLVPAITELLAEAGLDWADLERVAVDVGPGSFTGTRVGVAAAQGLAAARGVPVTGVGCLDILADACYHATSPAVGGYIVSAVDVRRGEVVWASFEVTDRGLRLLGEPALGSAETAPGSVPGSGWLSGDGAADLWPGVSLQRHDPDGRSRAAAAARIGSRMRTLEPVVPRYARPADARPRRRMV